MNVSVMVMFVRLCMWSCDGLADRPGCSLPSSDDWCDCLQLLLRPWRGLSGEAVFPELLLRGLTFVVRTVVQSRSRRIHNHRCGLNTAVDTKLLFSLNIKKTKLQTSHVFNVRQRKNILKFKFVDHPGVTPCPLYGLCPSLWEPVLCHNWEWRSSLNPSYLVSCVTVSHAPLLYRNCFVFFLLHIWREKVGFKNIQFIRTTEQVSTSISRINVDQHVLSYTTVSRSVFDWVFGVILSNNISLSSLGNHCFFHNTLRGLKSTTEPLADDPFKWNLDAKTFDLWCFAVGFEHAGVFGVHVSIFFVCKTS